MAALREVTVAFAAGTFTAIMGPSGSGKSTLLHCAAGLDRPTSGEVRVAGHEQGGLSKARLTVLRREQRLAIARVLVTGPAVMFADEPAGAPDSAPGHEVLALLRGPADHEGPDRRHGHHDPAISRADRVVFAQRTIPCHLSGE
jgi:ABC-type lipoprotein export system ATPase subunit